MLQKTIFLCETDSLRVEISKHTIKTCSLDQMNTNFSEIDKFNPEELEKIVLDYFRENNLSGDNLAIVSTTSHRLEALKRVKDALKSYYKLCFVQALDIERVIQSKAYLENIILINACSVKNEISDFNQYIDEISQSSIFSTGFNNLDNCLGGGALFPRVYVLGAETSAGKTTLALQIADNIASNGNDVIIFSLEMLKEEIIARSISRTTFIKNKNNQRLCFDESSILNGSNYKNYDTEQLQALRDAQKEYLLKVGDSLYIHQGSVTIDYIESFVSDYIKTKKRKPVIFIDYLQIIAPKDIKAADRFNVNYAVSRLKEIRSIYKIPVFVISSVSRSNYDKVKDNSAFKESGEIEFTADCTMMLDIKYSRSEDANTSRENYREAMSGQRTNGIREITLTILKNRGGTVGKQCYFYYYPKFNYFMEIDKEKFN